MGILSSLIGTGIGATIKSLGDTVGQFITTDKEKMELNTKFEAILQKRDSEIEQTIRAELKTRESIMVAEMNQGDNYTKRARPTVVYFGLAVIFINHLLAPYVFSLAGLELPKVELPKEFWYTWGSICSIWSIGRSVEKRGGSNKITNAITGRRELTGREEL